MREERQECYRRHNLQESNPLMFDLICKFPYPLVLVVGHIESVGKLTRSVPADRISLSEAVVHPAWWRPCHVMRFIVDVRLLRKPNGKVYLIGYVAAGG